MQMRGKESLFSISRMQLSLCKDNAKRGKESTLQKINTMAPACRDAKFCVSRATWRAGCLCFIPCISCASLLGRRKILRLPSNVTGWLSVCYTVCILRIFACETQDFASLLCWFATGKYGFSQFITMASACRDAKFCVSRAMC